MEVQRAGDRRPQWQSPGEQSSHASFAAARLDQRGQPAHFQAPRCATLNTSLAAQNPPLSVRYTCAPLIHLASDGSHLGAVAGADCFPLDSLPDGTTLCATKNAYSAPYIVRSRDGQPLWRLNVADNTYPFNPALSPDGQRVVDLGQLLAQDGSVKSVPGWQQNTWQQVGWIDGQTVVLGASNGASAHMLLIGVDDANAKPVDLGFSGYFAGVLS